MIPSENKPRGVGDDNRTAVSDEEAAWNAAYEFIDFVRDEILGDWAILSHGYPRDEAERLLAAADTHLDSMRAAAAARRDVPGGREAEQIVRDVSEQALRFRRAGRGTTPVQQRAIDWAASHPLERADSERDA